MFRSEDFEDVVFFREGERFTIKNVPYFHNEYGEEYFPFKVGIILETLRKFMLEERLPNTVDFQDYKNL